MATAGVLRYAALRKSLAACCCVIIGEIDRRVGQQTTRLDRVPACCLLGVEIAGQVLVILFWMGPAGEHCNVELCPEPEILVLVLLLGGNR